MAMLMASEACQTAAARYEVLNDTPSVTFGPRWQRWLAYVLIRGEGTVPRGSVAQRDRAALEAHLEARHTANEPGPMDDPWIGLASAVELVQFLASVDAPWSGHHHGNSAVTGIL